MIKFQGYLVTTVESDSKESAKKHDFRLNTYFVYGDFDTYKDVKDYLYAIVESEGNMIVGCVKGSKVTISCHNIINSQEIRDVLNDELDLFNVEILTNIVPDDMPTDESEVE